MSDKECYTNHVRIIGNTDARVVVHWRYTLVDVLHVVAIIHVLSLKIGAVKIVRS